MRVVPLVVLAVLSCAACAEPTVESSTRQSVLEGNRIVANRIVANRIVANRIVANRIVANRISNNRFRLNQQAAGDLLDDEGGRELLAYFVSCAVPRDITLVADHHGHHYEFPGDIGLAPKWIDRSLNKPEQRWVSACLISRVNKFAISIPISIRGPHNALTVTADEADEFSLEEAAFYGNIFTPLDEPIIWVACRGRSQAAGEGGGLSMRDCAEPDPDNPGLTMCGFTYAGDCADWSKPKNAYACKSFEQHFAGVRDDDDDDDRHGNGGHGGGGHGDHGDHGDHDGDCDDDDDDDMHEGGYYQKCHDRAGSGRWPHAEQYDEVVTVFLSP